MDQSSDSTSQKTSPLIIKLCTPSSNKESEASTSEPVKDIQPLTSPKTPVAVKMKPVAVTFCRLSKDGILSKSPESLKISPALSLKLGAALRERITLKCLPGQKATLDKKLDNSNEAERQSLTSHSSKLADDRLDFVHGGDKSQGLQLFQPPLTMQPSNLLSDDLLDAKYGGGGSEPSVVQESSSTLSPVASSSAINVKSAKKPLTTEEDEMEPARKKMKPCDTFQVGSESECESLVDVETKDNSAKRTKIIKFKNPPGKQNCLQSSIYVLEKGGLAIAQSRQMLPLTSISSSVEGAKDVSVNVELAKDKHSEDKHSALVRTKHPHFIIARSSNNSSSDSKKDSGIENLKSCSLIKSKHSDINQELMKPDLISFKVTETDANKVEIKKPSLLDLNPESKTIECSSSLSTDVLHSETATNVNDEKTEPNHTFVCPFSQPVKKEISKVSSVVIDQVEEINSFKRQKIIKNKSPELEGKNIAINSKDRDKISSPYDQDLKVCPFKLTFEGKFNAKSDRFHKTEFTDNFLVEEKNDNSKDSISSNVNDKFDHKSAVDNKDVMESDNCEIDNSRLFIEGTSKNNSQSESVVNYGEIEDKNLYSEEIEFGEQDEDFSGEDGNELLGISSDESNQMDSQNGTQEPEMEFDILDEFESNDNDPEPELRTSDSESEISADEIDAMLEAGLGDYGKPSVNNQHEVKEKVILKVRGKDHFEVLPEGWIEVTHNSGIPIYLHKQTRVCCVSKPYFLGPGSTRKHEIPISAIPCLHYLKELEKEKSETENKLNGISHDPEKEKNSTNKKDSNVVIENGVGDAMAKNHASENGYAVNASKVKSDTTGKNSTVQNASNGPKGSNLIFPSAKLESVKEVKVSGSLDHLAVREYCQKRFEFQTITVKRFKTWFGRRKYQKLMRRKHRPFLPDNTQLITCPLPSNTDKSTTVGNASKREFIMNPIGKSPVCILHEYVQHTLRVQPKYIFKELESASTPYGAVVIINDMEYGTGYGSSKKVAKSEAAKSALEVLIPRIKRFDSEKRSADEDEYQDVEFFDQVRVEDPRISDLSVKAGQPFPYQILLECLKRNYGMGDTEISIKMKNLKHQKNEFIMKVGKHKATVVCKNKRDGKHRASQAILQQLHPHINSWGSLLRMYGKGSCKTLKEKKEEEQRITELQSKACVNKPNISILNKLKEEMMKYREKMISKKPIGKLIPERMQLFSISDSNLKSIEL